MERKQSQEIIREPVMTHGDSQSQVVKLTHGFSGRWASDALEGVKFEPPCAPAFIATVQLSQCALQTVSHS